MDDIKEISDIKSAAGPVHGFTGKRSKDWEEDIVHRLSGFTTLYVSKTLRRENQVVQVNGDVDVVKYVEQKHQFNVMRV